MVSAKLLKKVQSNLMKETSSHESKLQAFNEMRFLESDDDSGDKVYF